MATISKQELVDRIAEQTGLSKAVVRKVFQGIIDEVSVGLCRNDRYEFRGFGVFELKHMAGRPAQNPRTGERFFVPEHNIVRFKPSLKLRNLVKGDPDSAQVHINPIQPDGKINHTSNKNK